MALNIDLHNSRALITGANSGIGLGIASVLAQAGCDVAGCGLEAEESEGALEFVSQVHSQSRRAFYQAVDLTDGAATRSFVEWAAAQCSVGLILSFRTWEQISMLAQLQQPKKRGAVLELNLAAHWRVVQTAKPYLDAADHPVVLIVASTQSVIARLRTRFHTTLPKRACWEWCNPSALEGDRISAGGHSTGIY